MTTLVVPLPVGLAKRVARAADRLGMSHEELARVAVALFCRAQMADERTNQPTNQPTNAKRRPRTVRKRP